MVIDHLLAQLPLDLPRAWLPSPPPTAYLQLLVVLRLGVNAPEQPSGAAGKLAPISFFRPVNDLAERVDICASRRLGRNQRPEEGETRCPGSRTPTVPFRCQPQALPGASVDSGSCGPDIVAAAEAGAGRGAGHSRGKSPLSPRKQFSKSVQNDRLCLLMGAEGGAGGGRRRRRIAHAVASRPAPAPPRGAAPLIFNLHMRIPWIAPCAFAVRVMMSTTPVGWPTWRSHAPDCVV